MSQNGKLTASFILKLEDKLTGGLRKLQERLEALQRLAAKFDIAGGGDLGNSKLKQTIDRTKELADSLGQVERRAAAAQSAIGRMARTAGDQVIRVNSQGVARLASSMAPLALAAVVAAAAAGGGGRLPPPRSASFASGPSWSIPSVSGPAMPLYLPRYGGGQQGIPLVNPFPPQGGQGFFGRAGQTLRGAGGAIANTFGQMQGQFGPLEGAAAGYSVIEPVRRYAEYENTLRHIAITQGKHGVDAEAEIKRLTALFAKDALETGQSSHSIAEAYSELIQIGIPAHMLDEVIKKHSRAATAYNITAAELGKGVGSLIQNFHIPEEGIGGALAAMATVSKEGRFKVADFSRQLPGIGGLMDLMGMRGRTGANTVFAAMETIMQNAGDPNQGAADFRDLLVYLTSNTGDHHFAKVSIDIKKTFAEAEKKGVDRLHALIAVLQAKTKGMNDGQRADFIGRAFGNQQSAMAAISLLQKNELFRSLELKAAAATERTLDIDFATAFHSPIVAMRMFDEQLEQIHRRIGLGFLPLVAGLNSGLGLFMDGLADLDKEIPGAAEGILKFLGAGLLLIAGLGTLGFVLPLVSKGFTLLMAPIRLVVQGLGWLTAAFASMLGVSVGWAVAIGAAIGGLGLLAYDMWAHWDPTLGFFGNMWEGVKRLFRGFVTWVDGWTGGAASKAIEGIQAKWGELEDWFGGMWNRIRAPFDKLVADVQSSWIGRTFGTPDQITRGLVEGDTKNPPIPGFGWLAPGAAAPQQIQGNITVRTVVDEYGRVISQEVSAESRTPGVTMTTPTGPGRDPDRGPFLGRP